MTGPIPKSSSVPGEGLVVANTLPTGKSNLEQIAYQYPLKLISPPMNAHARSVVLFMLSYGGGLVAGDSINLAVKVGECARLSIATQGHTKIFPSGDPDVATRQRLSVTVDSGAAFCLLPDPVQPFGGSMYEQTQTFTLADSASACILDWVTQGRAALGEDWSFTRWTGRNEVWRAAGSSKAKDRLLVRDAVVLDPADGDLVRKPLRDAMYGLGVFGTLIVRGPLAEPLGEFFIHEFKALPRIGARDFRTPEARARDVQGMSASERWRAQRVEAEKKSGVLWSAARVRTCVVVKFGAPSVEAGRNWLGSMLLREGSVAKIFGDEALICLR